MRFLAIDLGDKRTGLAVGDDETGIASPLCVLEIPRGDRLLVALLEAVRDHAPGALVVGLPVNMDGTEGPRAEMSRAFGDQVAAAAGLPVHYQDERLSSFAAEEKLARSGRTHKEKKRMRDALAAAAILQDFLDSRPRNPGPRNPRRRNPRKDH